MTLPVHQANCLALAEFIASQSQLLFDMASPDVPQQCGTPGCIGGFAAALWPECADDGHFDDRLTAVKLGLSTRQASQLFQLCWWEGRPNIWQCCQFEDVALPASFSLVTRQGACATLTRLATTGQVQWLLSEQHAGRAEGANEIINPKEDPQS